MPAAAEADVRRPARRRRGRFVSFACVRNQPREPKAAHAVEGGWIPARGQASPVVTARVGSSARNPDPRGTPCAQ